MLLLGLQAVNKSLVGGLRWVLVWMGLSPVPCSIGFYWDKGLLQAHWLDPQAVGPLPDVQPVYLPPGLGRASAGPLDRSLSGQDCS